MSSWQWHFHTPALVGKGRLPWKTCQQVNHLSSGPGFYHPADTCMSDYRRALAFGAGAFPAGAFPAVFGTAAGVATAAVAAAARKASTASSD